MKIGDKVVYAFVAVSGWVAREARVVSVSEATLCLFQRLDRDEILDGCGDQILFMPPKLVFETEREFEKWRDSQPPPEPWRYPNGLPPDA